MSKMPTVKSGVPYLLNKGLLPVRLETKPQFVFQSLPVHHRRVPVADWPVNLQQNVHVITVG